MDRQKMIFGGKEYFAYTAEEIQELEEAAYLQGIKDGLELADTLDVEQ